MRDLAAARVQAGGRRSRSVRGALLALALGGVAALAGGAAWARPHGGDCGGRHHGMGIEQLERKVPGLELAPDTEKAVYAAIDQARAKRRSLDRELGAAHERLRALLDQERPEVDAVLAQADKLGALRTELHKLELRAKVAVRALLSPEQWEQLHPKHHEHRHGGEPGEGH